MVRKDRVRRRDEKDFPQLLGLGEVPSADQRAGGLELFQLGVLGFGLLQDGDVGIGVFPGRWVAGLNHWDEPPVSCRRTTSDSLLRVSTPIDFPSKDQRNGTINPDLKFVIWRPDDPSSGCSHKLSTPFCLIEYTRAFPSGVNRGPWDIAGFGSM